MWQTSQYTVEDVVITLISTLGHNSRLLQQVLFNLSTFYYTVMIEMNVYIFAKPGWIVISDGLGISKCYGCNRIKNQIFKLGTINLKGQRNCLHFMYTLNEDMLFKEHRKLHRKYCHMQFSGYCESSKDKETWQTCSSDVKNNWCLKNFDKEPKWKLISTKTKMEMES